MKGILSLFVLLIIFSCKEEDEPVVIPEDPKPVGAVAIDAGAEVATTLSVTRTATQGFAITGFVYGTNNNFHPFVAIIDKALKVSSFKAPVFTNDRYFGTDIVTTPTHYFIVSHNLPDNLVYELEGIGLTKLDNAGSVVWEKSFFHNISYEVEHELQFSGDHIYFLGNDITDNTCFVAKFDTDGNVVDEHKFTGLHYASDLKIGSDISFFACTFVLGNYPEAGGGDWKYIPHVVKTDLEGNIRWKTALTPSYGLPAYADMAMDQQGNYAVVHSERILVGNLFNRYLYLSHVSSTGELRWTKPLHRAAVVDDYLKIGSIQTNAAGEIFLMLETSNKEPLLLKYDKSGILLKFKVFTSLAGLTTTDMILEEDGSLVVVGTKVEKEKSYIIRINQELEIL